MENLNAANGGGEDFFIAALEFGVGTRGGCGGGVGSWSGRDSVCFILNGFNIAKIDIEEGSICLGACFHGGEIASIKKDLKQGFQVLGVGDDDVRDAFSIHVDQAFENVCGINVHNGVGRVGGREGFEVVRRGEDGVRGRFLSPHR